MFFIFSNLKIPYFISNENSCLLVTLLGKLFARNTMSAEVPKFKQFVSEDDIASAKQKRQEEWEKVRQPHQPEGKRTKNRAAKKPQAFSGFIT